MHADPLCYGVMLLYYFVMNLSSLKILDKSYFKKGSIFVLWNDGGRIYKN